MKNSISKPLFGRFVVHACLALSFLSICENADAQRRGGRGGRGGFGGEPGKRIEPKDLPFELGVATIPDRKTFESLSYRGPDVMRDSYLADLEFVKFIIEGIGQAEERVYFMNTNNHRAHPRFMPQVGINSRGAIRGALTYLPLLKAPDGSEGLYTIDFQPNDSYRFEEIAAIVKSLSAKMPILEGKIAFHPLSGNIPQYEEDKEKYSAANLAVHLDEDLREVFLPLNPAESFGKLRIMGNDARPSPRDIVIYKTLPNQMPRVAGVITEARQTPLSHVNLRAVQDRIPNAFIKGVLKDDLVSSLIGEWVRYRVTPGAYTVERATMAEVEQYFSEMRPKTAQIPQRNLEKKAVLALSEMGFKDSDAFGVKAANLAAMLQFDLPAGSVPQGYAVPFHFYHQFMLHNGLYREVDALLGDDATRKDVDQLTKALKSLRKKIRKGSVPAWMEESLAKVYSRFDPGTPVRCRSSTNNEDLPGFSGAGLYDSFTHNPDEGPLSKTIRQVYASMWNYRAFEEREFYRIDHKMAAMGVLLHPNFKEEQLNGVAVSDDILYETYGNYYVNNQLGEDLVTNPDEDSSPEEILLAWFEKDGHEVVRKSLEAPENGQLLGNDKLKELRADLTIIHEGFRKLYGFDQNRKFAMEIEYKVTKEGKLVIKQARPWVF